MPERGLSAQSRKQLSQLLRAGEPVLTPVRAAAVLSITPLQAAQQLARWAKAGWLARARRGAYVPVPIESGSADVRLEDPWTVAAQLFAPCYVGGWSAAEHWGLTEQLFRAVCVMTATRPRVRRPVLRGTQYHLHTVARERLFGLKTVWRGQMRVQVSDPVRTLADMLGDPGLGGGVRHVADMLDTLFREHRKDVPRLIADLDRLGNGAAFKRLGYLLETGRAAETTMIEECRRRLTAGYVKLDPALPSERLVTAWRLWTPAGIEKRATK